MFATQFKNAYLASLHDHFRSFYDDVSEYGDPQSKHCIYFVHGIDGAAGQIRFPLPAASRYFRDDLYMKSLYTDGFSCRNPIWDKYTIANVAARVSTIVEDLTQLVKRYGTVMVFCSSNGFYDFYAAASKLDAATQACLRLFWVACAPDHFAYTNWERVFYSLNGFVHGKYRWVALPNCNYLRWLNPEVPYQNLSRAHKPYRYYYKYDMESRFYLYKTLWSYFSIPCFNECLDYLTGHSDQKLTMPAYVLAAQYDGYWQGKTMQDMQRIMERYIANPVVVIRPTSHLWTAAPEHVYAILQTAFGENGEKLGLS